MKNFLIATIAMLSLFGGRAMAQRCLPGMSAVEFRTDMVDGFFTGNSRNCGYSFGVYYSIFKGNNANTWTVGGEYLQTYKPYGEKGRIPIADFYCEAGYNLHLYSSYAQFFHLYGGISVLAGYETVNWGESILKDGATLQADDAFIYGGAINVAADFYLTDNFALGVNLKERFIFGNNTGHFRFSYGLTAKYTF
ncbi:MAG: conjugal transfer protein TraO [Muribaculum sp.]|nr:conjugal transfer protein TraO [Muribaculum sp.]